MLDLLNNIYAHVQAHKFGIKYPRYVFLTYGSYESQWWATQYNDECSLEDIAEVLQFSLAVLHFHVPSTDNIFYHLCYDAVWALTYALHEAVHNMEEILWVTDSYSGSGSGQLIDCFCRNISTVPSLIKKHLRTTSFMGNSVSIPL